MRDGPLTAILGEGTTLRHAAWCCLLSALALSLLGVYAIDLGAQVDAPRTLSELSPLAARQAIFVVAGIIAAIIVAIPRERTLRALAWPALGVSVVLLAVLLVPWVPAWLVAPRNGVRGWFNLGVVDFQPGEVARIAFVLAGAAWLRDSRHHRTIVGLLPPALITAVPVGLIFLQPDLGMASLFVPAMFAMLLCAGARLKHLALVVAVGLAAAPAAYPLLKPYQQQRIIGLVYQLRGDKHTADDINYQSVTAQMLASAGQRDGYDDAKARAVVRFAELPERHNDMILSVIMARFGFVGGLGLLALYALWLAGALITALTARDAFGRLVCVGLATLIAVQVVVNLGMVLGMLPIVGLTLPFVSYGGSSMLSVWIMTGLVFSIAMRRTARVAHAGVGTDD